jgi:hypothetical protein
MIDPNSTGEASCSGPQGLGKVAVCSVRLDSASYYFRAQQGTDHDRKSPFRVCPRFPYLIVREKLHSTRSRPWLETGEIYALFSGHVAF